MGLKNRNCTVLVLLLVIFLISGCSTLIGDWTDTSGMEEYGNMVAKTRDSLKGYVGKYKNDIIRDFGEPHKIEKREGSKAVLNQPERVKFDENWEYCYSRGVIMINFERGCKKFYFKNNIVVFIDAG